MKLQAATWMRRAAKLADALPKSRLHPAVLDWTTSRRTRDPWFVALSGGVDSVSLLLLVWSHWPEQRERLRAVHYNHRLRGRSADTDEKFCRELCRALGVKLLVGRRRLSQRMTNEAQARDLRFAMIDRVMQQARSRTLWLGHQQNDLAETMLMRLSRGSGTAGLAAPRPVQSMPSRRIHLRPLLNLQRGAIEQAMTAARLPWRVDASNAGGDYFRNRIRRDVVPNWVEASGRDALAGAALSRELLDEDDIALAQWSMRLCATMPVGRLDLRLLADVPRAVVRRVLHTWMLDHTGVGTLSRQAFGQLLDAVIAGQNTRQSMGRHHFAVIRRHELYMELNPGLRTKLSRR
jgi:tRNA(Ile)-lysidine synthase